MFHSVKVTMGAEGAVVSTVQALTTDSLLRPIVQDSWAGSLERQSRGGTAVHWDNPKTVKNCFLLLMH
jgi:hypothetical protein